MGVNLTNDNMPNRCDWCENTFEQYVNYHDTEWGVPVSDDFTHFEFLILESAQAGLSWSTILKRREGYRHAFANFDVEKVARFNEEDVKRLLHNEDIIRNEAKIRAAINNAQQFIAIQEEVGSFNKFIWSFVNGVPVQNNWQTIDEIPAKTEISTKLSKELKDRGFSFIGPTTIYANMQATGLVNDHLVSCFRYEDIKAMS
jgi:DNA-3-methyladenine glycosylase I